MVFKHVKIKIIKEGHTKNQVSVFLTQEEHGELEAIGANGRHNSQKVINMLILLNYDENVPKLRT
jgi:hypothetical protein